MKKDFRYICFESLFESNLKTDELILIENDLSENQ